MGLGAVECLEKMPVDEIWRGRVGGCASFDALYDQGQKPAVFGRRASGAQIV
jgi:hypothetical protein